MLRRPGTQTETITLSEQMHPAAPRRPRRRAPKPGAQVYVDKTYVRTGVDGRVEQFLVRTGDVINQWMRPGRSLSTRWRGPCITSPYPGVAVADQDIGVERSLTENS